MSAFVSLKNTDKQIKSTNKLTWQEIKQAEPHRQKTSRDPLRVLRYSELGANGKKKKQSSAKGFTSRDIGSASDNHGHDVHRRLV